MSRTDRNSAANKSAFRLYTFGCFLAAAIFCVVLKQFIGTSTGEAQTGPQNRSQQQARGQQQRAPQQGVRQASVQAPVGQTLEILALVNGDQISRQQLGDECLKRFGAEVMERLVNRQLILSACERHQVIVTPEQIESEVELRAGNLGIPTDQYLAMLQSRRQITPDQFRQEIIWPTLALRALARDQIQVTPEEIQQQLETEIGPKVQVRLIALDDEASATKVHELARANPEEFGKLAKDYSVDANSASTRGMVPPIRLHLGNETIERTAFSLQPGQISEVVQLGDQFIILKCERQFESQIDQLDPAQRKLFQQRIISQVSEKKLAGAAQELLHNLQESTRITNVYNDPELRQQNPGVAAIIGDAQISIRDLAEECIARHGADVLDGEINRALMSQQLKRANLTVTEADINEEIHHAADAYGMLKQDGSADVDGWLEYVTKDGKVTVELYVHDVVWPTAALKKLVANDVAVSEEDLQRGFESNFGERVEALAIVCGNQKQAQEVWNLANQNPTDEYFGNLANAYSIEPASKANFGRVPPIQKHGGRKALEEEAFRLQPGELSGIVNIGESWIVLRCLGRTTPRVRPEDFEDVRGELEKDILEKKTKLAMNTRFHQIRQASQIDNYLAGTSQMGSGAIQQRTAQTVQDRMPFRVQR